MKSYKEKDIIDILRNIPIFQGLNDEECAAITPLLKPEKYPPGTRIIKEGAHGDAMCIIIKGSVKVTKSAEASGEVLLETLYSGSYFGEFSLVDNMPRSADITSLDETELFRLGKKDFDALLMKNGTIATAFYKNCLEITFTRFRTIISNYAFSQHHLRVKSTILDELARDLSLAKNIQSYFINRELLDNEASFLPGVRHSYIYKPCIEIGGDFLNVTKLKGGNACIIIADLMGHGITSALGTGVFKSAYSLSIKELGEHPAKLMNFLNTHLLNVISQLYATCYIAVADMRRKKIKLAKAGHPHPLFWKARKQTFIDINCQGTGLGLVKKARFGHVEYPVERGDKILFFTDGIIEQRNPGGEMYTEARLRSVFMDLIVSGQDSIVENIYRHAESFSSGAAPEDDVTLLLLEF